VGVDSALRNSDGSTLEWAWGETDWAAIGYAYIPSTCFEYWDEEKGTLDRKPCHIHVSFSGAGKSGELV